MKVTISIKRLIHELESRNPEADLSGVKAYLFDLMMDSPQGANQYRESQESVDLSEEHLTGEGSFESEEEPNEESETGSGEPALPHEEKNVTLAQIMPDLNLPIKNSGLKVSSRGGLKSSTIQMGKPSQDKKAEREARRQRAAATAGMSGKDILKQLTENIGKTDTGQFTDTGVGDDSQPGADDGEAFG